MKMLNSLTLPWAALRPALTSYQPAADDGSAISGVTFHWKTHPMEAGLGLYSPLTPRT